MKEQTLEEIANAGGEPANDYERWQEQDGAQYARMTRAEMLEQIYELSKGQDRAEETSVERDDRLPRVPLEMQRTKDGKPTNISDGDIATPDLYAYRKRIMFTYDGGYSLSVLESRAVSMAREAFSLARIGGLDERSQAPTFERLPDFKTERSLNVAVWVE